MKALAVVPILIGLLVAGVLVGNSPFGRYGLRASGAPVEVKVNVKEYNVEMSQTDLPAGVPIKFVVSNTGNIKHEVVLEKAGANDEPLEIENQEDTADKASEVENIELGTTRSATWNITQPGNYQLACHVEGHFEDGMVKTFQINPNDASSLLARSAGWIGGGALAVALAIIASIFVSRRLKS